MFDTSGAFSGFSVTDVEEAREFYGGLLGLDVHITETGMLIIALASGAHILLYPKHDHVPATYTVLNFAVEDVGAAVAELTAVGVAMLHYPGMPQDADGVMRGNGPEIAWLSDPSGNVLSVVENV